MAETIPVDVASRGGDRILGPIWSGQPALAGRGIPAASADDRAPDSKAIDQFRADATGGDWTDLLLRAQSIGNLRLLYALLLKRWIDAALATVALVVLGPLLLLIALAVRVDSPGPALFRQGRIGRGGTRFVVYKFRTMVVDPGVGLVFLRADDGSMRHKVKNDPRITRVGKFLRRTSLDELPQLINVVRGEMSLVGPRPELPELVQRYEPWQHRRHLVRPGLTGWWQVSGRSDKPMHEHTELDLYYVANLSFRLDLKVVLRTVRVVLFGSGAF